MLPTVFAGRPGAGRAVSPERRAVSLSQRLSARRRSRSTKAWTASTGTRADRPMWTSSRSPLPISSSTVDPGNASEFVLLLTIEDAGKALGVGRSTIYQLIADGDLEVVHIGRSARVPVESVEGFVRRLRAG